MSAVAEKTVHRLSDLFAGQRERAQQFRLDGPAERRQRLKTLQAAINASKAQVEAALYADLRKPAPEVHLTELLTVSLELKHALRHLRRWMKPAKVRPPAVFAGSRNWIRYEPRGVCLILAPWNYPFQLAFGPLISAIAAGNTAVVKPSEYTPATSALIRSIVEQNFDPAEVAVVEGDGSVARELLELPFNHIFFTGSTDKGRLVMEAAARHLSSVTLELGGKSPAIIEESGDLSAAARRIAWGKFLNSGQTCVAPDYVLVHRSRQDQFIEELTDAIAALYGPQEKLADEGDYTRIVSDGHFDRLALLLKTALDEGAALACGGDVDAADRYIAPTVLTGLPLEASIMDEEIFGPLLPVFAYDDLDEAIQYVNDHPRPLALYVFSKKREQWKRVIARTSAGDTAINDVAIHYGNVNLPFGGINASGMGKSHGFHGFKSFSHQRSVMKQPRFPVSGLLYPPYTPTVRKLIDLTLRYF